MMTRRSKDRERWVYGFSLEDRVPEDHLLRKIKKAIDFNFIYPLVEKHYSHTGAPSIDPVVVFKLSLIGYLYDIRSERRLMEEASLNLAYLWFLDYDIDEELPDHSIMTKTRVRFGVEAYREFFHRVVEECAKAGLIEGETLFLDSTLIDSQCRYADVRSKSLVDELNRNAQEFVKELFEEGGETGKTGSTSAGKDEGKDERRNLSQVGSASAKKEGHAQGAQGKGGDVDKPPCGVPKKANERFSHPHDPDADMVRRTKGPGRLCYKGHFAVDGGDARIITAVSITGGAVADEHLLMGLLAEHEELVGRPADLVADQKYGTSDQLPHS